MWLHFAHSKQLIRKEGDFIPAGRIVGYVGDTGTTPTPGHNGNSHLHFEILKQDPAIRGYNAYTKNLTREQVEELYFDPNEFLEGKTFPLPGGKVTGFGWLDKINDNGDLHPGLDINVGGGYDDYGIPFLAPVDMRVVKVIENAAGWGNHIFCVPESAPVILPPKQSTYMALYDNQSLVYVPVGDAKSWEFYVIKKHKVAPLQTAHKVRRRDFGVAVALFKDQPNGIQVMSRKAQADKPNLVFLEGLTSGPAWVPGNEFRNNAPLARIITQES